MFCRMTVGCLGAGMAEIADLGLAELILTTVVPGFLRGCDTGGYGGCDRAACAGDSGGDAGV